MSGEVSESLLLELLELLELLLESSRGSLGGRAVGNGWSAAAEPLAGTGAVASGVTVGLLASSGNGNCSETDGFVASAAGGVQGL